MITVDVPIFRGVPHVKTAADLEGAYVVIIGSSYLIVIEVQESLMKKFQDEKHELLLNRIGWIVNVATRLDIPLVAMAEEIPAMGSAAPSIAEKFPKDTTIHDRMGFGLAAGPEILDAVKKTGRKLPFLAYYFQV